VVARRLIGDAVHFWQKRYYDFNVRDYPQFVEKLRYIHHNPVKRTMRSPGRLAVEQLSPLLDRF
jgi:REP element-mobilizing transposase RayT